MPWPRLFWSTSKNKRLFEPHKTFLLHAETIHTQAQMAYTRNLPMHRTQQTNQADLESLSSRAWFSLTVQSSWGGATFEVWPKALLVSVQEGQTPYVQSCSCTQRIYHDTHLRHRTSNNENSNTIEQICLANEGHVRYQYWTAAWFSLNIKCDYTHPWL